METPGYSLKKDKKKVASIDTIPASSSLKKDDYDEFSLALRELKSLDFGNKLSGHINSFPYSKRSALKTYIIKLMKGGYKKTPTLKEGLLEPRDNDRFKTGTFYLLDEFKNKIRYLSQKERENALKISFEDNYNEDIPAKIINTNGNENLYIEMDDDEEETSTPPKEKAAKLREDLTNRTSVLEERVKELKSVLEERVKKLKAEKMDDNDDEEETSTPPKQKAAKLREDLTNRTSVLEEKVKELKAAKKAELTDRVEELENKIKEIKLSTRIKDLGDHADKIYKNKPENKVDQEKVEMHANSFETVAGNDGKDIATISSSIPQDVQEYNEKQNQQPIENTMESEVKAILEKDNNITPFKKAGFGPPPTVLDKINTNVETIKDVQLRTPEGKELIEERLKKLEQLASYIGALDKKYVNPYLPVAAYNADIAEKNKDQLSTTENQRTWASWKQQMYGKLGRKFD